MTAFSKRKLLIYSNLCEWWKKSLLIPVSFSEFFPFISQSFNAMNRVFEIHGEIVLLSSSKTYFLPWKTFPTIRTTLHQVKFQSTRSSAVHTWSKKWELCTFFSQAAEVENLTENSQNTIKSRWKRLNGDNYLMWLITMRHGDSTEERRRKKSPRVVCQNKSQRNLSDCGERWMILRIQIRAELCI